ncbi:fungal-specific transcription factor domain-containing protein [Mycena alexandri]|uniref:Fungal-specific transcription factor domain-containing protein n=1 Tax=Mycena alexandri TaxID=1745969 RepID=A0AAD6SU52_9AGAR|nr:fungal-specific transcription factor domain-containing protein [Mycena alexandri]
MSATQNAKPKRRPACDICRKNKRRCEGGQRCSRCAKYDLACTYAEPAAPRDVDAVSDSNDAEYVEILKLRLGVAEAALTRQEAAQTGLAFRAIRSLAQPFPPPHPDDAGFLEIADSFQALSLDGVSRDPGFQGKSSAAMLVKAAVEIKPANKPWTPPRNRPPPRRWTLKPWETETDRAKQHTLFPDDSLMSSLVSCYFSNVNHFLPLLHRGIFEESIRRRLYIQDPSFGSVLLLVCALGSLYLTGAQNRPGLGWECYDQIELCGHSLRQQPTLYDLQAYCLATQFLCCAASPRVAWRILGFGARLMEDIGAHRRKARGNMISVEEELEKRAVWVLLLLDTFISGTLGRSTALDPLEIDISLPSDCDDEYWEPRGPGTQPHTHPSSTTFFTCLINLYRILHFAQRSLYVTVASQLRTVPGGRNNTSFINIARELDTALDGCFSTIPPHLIWDPERLDHPSFDQSASLYCLYCYTRIIVWRPFIPAISSGMMQPDPNALVVCVRAARSCIDVAQVHRQRSSDNVLPFSQSPIFSSAMVLLLDQWSNQDLIKNPEEDSQSPLLAVAIDILKSQHKHWASSDFYVDVLERLIALEDKPDLRDDLIHAFSVLNNPMSGVADDMPISPGFSNQSASVPDLSGVRTATGMQSSNSMQQEEEMQQRPEMPSTMVDAPVPPPQVVIPPVFVGDEEIVRRRRIPRVI